MQAFVPHAAPDTGRCNDLPLVLIGNSKEWSARSLESVFPLDEYEVHRVDSGLAVLAHARTINPDLIILDQDLEGLDALSVCRTLSDAGACPTTPIVIVTAIAAPERAERLRALDAGAWDIISLPLEGDTLVLRLRNFLVAKRASDRLRPGILVDARTGLYNRRGFELRCREVSGTVQRAKDALACAVLTLEVSAAGTDVAAPQPPAVDQRADYVAGLLRQHGRVSDVSGRLDDYEFALLLPSTREPGVRCLLERLQSSIAAAPPVWSGGQSTRLRAGYALADLSGPGENAIGLIERASRALERTRGQPVDVSIQGYDGAAVSSLA
jgi:PleD family two-component response regulator